MKQIINDMYQCPMSQELQEYLFGRFCEEDRSIIRSLREHNAPSTFHYDNTGICRERFERRLNSINRILLPELIRLANEEMRKTTAY